MAGRTRWLNPLLTPTNRCRCPSFTAVTVAPPPLIVQEADFVIVGGTGRFEHATGWLRGVVYVTFEGFEDPSWPIEFAIAGAVAY